MVKPEEKKPTTPYGHKETQKNSHDEDRQKAYAAEHHRHHFHKHRSSSLTPFQRFCKKAKRFLGKRDVSIVLGFVLTFLFIVLVIFLLHLNNF